MKQVLASLLFAFFSGPLAGLAQGAPVEAAHTTVELISEVEAIAPGASFDVALQFNQEPHWHIYWTNPGASGLPVELEWDLPDGFEAGEIQWPAPERIPLGGLINYGYEGLVTLIVPIQAPDSVEVGRTVELNLEAFWLICKEVCLPGEASLRLALPVAADAKMGPRVPEFTAARESQPKEGAPWGLSAAVDGRNLVLSLEAGVGAPVPLPDDLYFYAEPIGWVDPNAEQALEVRDDGAGARLVLATEAPFFEASPDRIRGVLQSGEGNWAVEIPIFSDDNSQVSEGGGLRENQLTIGRGFMEGSSSKLSKDFGPRDTESTGFEAFLLNFGLPGWLALAFLGGLILNVMPCVLPVLSLKVFSLLKHSGQTRGQAFLHGFAYTVGVVASFLLLAVFLFGLRAVGERIGWGFQLQSPNFVVILAIIFFLFALNLMGVFEIGSRLVGADTKASKRNDLVGSFGMGVLAAVVGAPCMGPLVASVSGLAVQANPATGMLIFGMMGLGLASPFLVLSVFPKLVGYLPKPGIWMESLKQFMGFLLMAAVVFLALVAGGLGGVDAVITLLIVLLLVGLAAWVYGRWSVPVRPKRTRWIARFISAVLLIVAAYYGVTETRAAYDRHGASVSAAVEGQWAAWSTDRVEQELAAGNPVFVDFTATWCLICQVNKRVALRTAATTELFAEYGIVALEADWTRYDAEITDELERHGRSGVPLYLLITPDGAVSILPQSLTNGIIREAVENALN